MLCISLVKYVALVWVLLFEKKYLLFAQKKTLHLLVDATFLENPKKDFMPLRVLFSEGIRVKR